MYSLQQQSWFLWSVYWTELAADTAVCDSVSSSSGALTQAEIQHVITLICLKCKKLLQRRLSLRKHLLFVQWVASELHCWRFKVPFKFPGMCSDRNDFAFIWLSGHSCRFPHLQVKYKADRNIRSSCAWYLLPVWLLQVHNSELTTKSVLQLSSPANVRPLCNSWSALGIDTGKYQF